MINVLKHVQIWLRFCKDIQIEIVFTPECQGNYELRRLVLYSQIKGVEQKYILYISGSVAYRQYIHQRSSPQSPYCLTAVSHFPPPLPPRTLPPLWLSAAEYSLHNGSRTQSQSPLLPACRRLLSSLSSLDWWASRPAVSLG